MNSALTDHQGRTHLLQCLIEHLFAHVLVQMANFRHDVRNAPAESLLQRAKDDCEGMQ